MVFIVKKKINGKEYYYLRESVRVDGKVKAKTLAYLGKTLEEAERKKKEFLDKIKNKDNIEKNLNEEVRGVYMNDKKISIEELANFCKSKGFVFRSSDIYGGFSGFWDFGPLGVEMFNNIKREWWNFFVQQKENMVGIDASIISHPRTWKASGHLDNFNDMMIYCKKNKRQFRVDHLIETILGINVEGKDENQILKIVSDNNEKFLKFGYDLDDKIIPFNLMFNTSVGPVGGEIAYLRGETAQGMFMDFKLVQQTSRKQLPFGIAQIGKCFRNEIAPRDFLFRSREFNIAEFEFFINPDDDKCDFLDEEHLNLKVMLLDEETQKEGRVDLKEVTIKEMIERKKLGEWHAYWLAEQVIWFKKFDLDKIKIREHTKDELSHYSSATFDLDYEYPFGSKEVGGNANRGQYDLTQHEKESKEKMEIFDDKTGKKVIPRVIEPTFGVERIFLAALSSGYHFDSVRGNVVLKLHPKFSPVKAAVFPIVKNSEFEKISEEIVSDLKKEWNVLYDKSGSIGRRYARNDEIGTPFCITVDGDSIKDNSVTVRDRDTTKQIRVKISELKVILKKLIDREINFEKAGRLI